MVILSQKHTLLSLVIQSYIEQRNPETQTVIHKRNCSSLQY